MIVENMHVTCFQLILFVLILYENIFLSLQLLNIKTMRKVVWKPNSIMIGNSKDLSQLRENTIALTVTSPPYHNAINYQEHQDTEKWYRGTVEVSLEDWLEEMKSVFSEVYRVTKHGGYCCIVIGNEIIEGKSKASSSSITSCRIN